MTSNRQCGFMRWIIIAVTAILFESIFGSGSMNPWTDQAGRLVSVNTGIIGSLCRDHDFGLRFLDVCRVLENTVNIVANVPMPVEKAACLGDAGKTCHNWCFDGNQTNAC